MKKIKIILLSLIFLLILYSVDVLAFNKKSEIECKYVSTPSLKPQETFSFISICKENIGCETTYKLNGKVLPSTSIVDLKGWAPPNVDGQNQESLKQVYCPKIVSINHYINKNEYNGKYDNIDITEQEEINETGVYVEIEDDKVRVHIGFILQKENYIYKGDKLKCGSNEGSFENIPAKIPELTSFAVNLIQVLVPIILVIFGSIDLFKGITANKEDEMKKGQQLFIKRLVVAAVIFLLVIIIKFFISVVADANASNIADCIDCFISNDCEEM